MLHIKTGDLGKNKIRNWIIPVCEDGDIHDDVTVASLVEKLAPFKEFSGKTDDEFMLTHPGVAAVERAMFFGVGPKSSLNPEALRAMAGKAVKKCIRCGLNEAMMVVPPEKELNLAFETMITAAMEGSALGNHLFDVYKNEKKYSPLKKIHFFIGSRTRRKYSLLANRVETVCRGAVAAREWVSTPANDKRPEAFARKVLAGARKEKLKTTVLDERALKREKFGGILAVAAGSTSKPRMVAIEHIAPGAKKTVVLVGKGVTFDAGGINLKQTGFIEDMKMDMAGAAAVAATLITAARLHAPVNVVGVIPLVENMPSGSATRPGDIIRTFSGKTVEIGNTDAEGRLILADALAWAIKRYRPDWIVDAATLTGACAVALGEKIAGVFSFDNTLAEWIVTAGDKTHERCWRMPMPDDYKALLKSEFADIHNMSSSRYGGAIAAALFLSEFVGDAVWAHIDIAGPAYVKKATDYCGAGGTGFGVRLFCELLERLGEEQ